MSTSKCEIANSQSHQPGFAGGPERAGNACPMKTLLMQTTKTSA
uniref:Uncharacterized protein n=1 Tax=Melanopsichium pennsylvanicum 4 TaxID=1398559 RepID=A0A077RBI7_9BASI|nr:uncharacterized protein BN887_06257 [Melanopsichium pennsylvanicum 4]